MKEDRIGFGRTDPAEVWQRSPLTRDAIVRVLEAPGFPRVSTGVVLESICLAFAKLLDWTMYSAFIRPPVSLKRRQAAAKSFMHFIEGVTPHWAGPDPPPSPPDEWIKAMTLWSEVQLKSTAQRGAPKDQFDHFTYPLLLGFYWCVYGRRPSSTAGGPTERFLVAAFDEMEAAVAGMVITPPERAEKVQISWRKPAEPGTLQRKVRDFVPAAEAKIKIVEHLIGSFITKLEAAEAGVATHH